MGLGHLALEPPSHRGGEHVARVALARRQRVVSPVTRRCVGPGNHAIAALLADERDTGKRAPTQVVVQRVNVGRGAAGAILGGIDGVGAALAAPALLSVGAGAAAGLVAGGLLGWATGSNRIGAVESEVGLAGLQSQFGGTSQGTLCVFRTAAGAYYMIEQVTNNLASAWARANSITYVPQNRTVRMDAEMRFVVHAEAHHIPLRGTELWVSKPVCGGCHQVLAARGVIIRTSTTPTVLGTWTSPDGHRAADLMPANPTLRVTRHRTEAEGLRAGQTFNDWEERSPAAGTLRSGRSRVADS